MSMFFLLIAGSRDFTDKAEFERIVGENIGPESLMHEVVIVEGGCRGVDSMARHYAISRGLMLDEFKPEWKKYGRAAGPKRNDQMTDWLKENARGHDECMALFFWDGESKGTKHCIESAKKRGIPARIWNTKTGKYMEGEENNEHNHNDPD